MLGEMEYTHAMLQCLGQPRRVYGREPEGPGSLSPNREPSLDVAIM